MTERRVDVSVVRELVALLARSGSERCRRALYDLLEKYGHLLDSAGDAE